MENSFSVSIHFIVQPTAYNCNKIFEILKSVCVSQHLLGFKGNMLPGVVNMFNMNNDFGHVQSWARKLGKHFSQKKDGSKTNEKESIFFFFFFALK